MKCIICGKTKRGYGNNPDPITNEKGELFDVNARCCDECDNKYVLPYRLAQLTGNVHEMQSIQKEVNKLRGFEVPKKLIARIERPDGSTYEQEIEYIEDSKIKSVRNAQKKLGNPYAWATIRGRKERYIRKDAYIIVDAYFVEAN